MLLSLSVRSLLFWSESPSVRGLMSTQNFVKILRVLLNLKHAAWSTDGQNWPTTRTYKIDLKFLMQGSGNKKLKTELGYQSSISTWQFEDINSYIGDQTEVLCIRTRPFPFSSFLFIFMADVLRHRVLRNVLSEPLLVLTRVCTNIVRILTSELLCCLMTHWFCPRRSCVAFEGKH